MNRYVRYSYTLNLSRKLCAIQTRIASTELNNLFSHQNTLYIIFVFVTVLVDSKLYHSPIGKYSFISQEKVIVFPWCYANETNLFICK